MGRGPRRLARGLGGGSPSPHRSSRAAAVLPGLGGAAKGRRLIVPCLRAVSLPASSPAGLSPSRPAPRWRAAPRGIPGASLGLGGGLGEWAKGGQLALGPEGPHHPLGSRPGTGWPTWSPAGLFGRLPHPHFIAETLGWDATAQATPSSPIKIILILGLERLSFPSAWGLWWRGGRAEPRDGMGWDGMAVGGPDPDTAQRAGLL